MRFIVRQLRDSCTLSEKAYISDTLSTVAYFRQLGFDVVIFVPAAGWLFPFTWRLILHERRQLTVSRREFSRRVGKLRRVAFLYHLTCLQLYGDAEEWTHCVCEVFSRTGQRTLFDSLSTDRCVAIQGNSHFELQRRWGIILAIRDTET